MNDPNARRLIDVEHVVHWACASELPKSRARDAIGTGPLPISREDASLVGRWNRPAGFPTISPMFAQGFASRGSVARGGAPDPDALVIEEKIGELGKRLDGLKAPEELALDLGFAVDIEGAFSAALRNVGNLVLVHGRLGSRPSIGAEMPAPSPWLAPNNRPGVWRRERIATPTIGGDLAESEIEAPTGPIKKSVYPTGAYCKVRWTPDPQLIVNDRAEYLAWRVALDALAELLSGALDKFTALAATAAPMPWRGDTDGDPFPDLFAPGAARVYSRAECAAIEARRAARARRETARRFGGPRPAARDLRRRGALGGED